jgi:hypothetical protein
MNTYILYQFMKFIPRIDACPSRYQVWFQVLGDVAEDGGQETNGGLIDLAQQIDNRGHATPCHRLGPFQRGLDGGQQCAAPVILQDAAAPFGGVVLAVIGRVVRQFQRASIPLRETRPTVSQTA